MKCTNCGANLEFKNSLKFCPYCGNILPEEKPSDSELRYKARMRELSIFERDRESARKAELKKTKEENASSKMLHLAFLVLVVMFAVIVLKSLLF